MAGTIPPPSQASETPSMASKIASGTGIDPVSVLTKLFI